MRSRQTAQFQQPRPGICAVPHSADGSSIAGPCIAGPAIAYESLDQRGNAMEHAARLRPTLVGEAGRFAASAEQPGKVIELEAVSVRYGLGRSATTALDETTLRLAWIILGTSMLIGIPSGIASRISSSQSSPSPGYRRSCRASCNISCSGGISALASQSCT